ncbi:MAG: hypothetical protein KGL39_16700 [Patescibacteria group bacterium]|nr:hypothetical protein [Patescibacteria group bacterium]
MENLGFGSNPFLGKDNPYLTQNIDTALGDITRNYNLAVKPNMESSMVNSGSFGNSGLQQMQGEQQRQLGQTLGNTAAQMRGNDYLNQQNMYRWDQDFNRGIFNDAFNQNQQQLNNYMGLLNLGNQFGQQDISNQTTMYNTPLTYQTTFGNMANAAGGLGGTSTAGTSMPGNPLLGAVGGWGLGQQLGKMWG